MFDGVVYGDSDGNEGINGLLLGIMKLHIKDEALALYRKC
ncbi:hypothetical protein MNV_20042 [Candidatus Methanoperedens nitroreducens]|uniref:Uncharacterized protein n=1 Tax=Candidatus Methanoperedens nitratireducens TaxID=1392998 RepID=A0A284VN12_9EURY|nr:hypothetical protein MNV_20042 [Candidatus Methanoperedens nitroreducens]